MADINNPQTVWIQGRCHRINPTTDKLNLDVQCSEPGKLAAYQETDLYGEEDRDLEGEIKMINNKFVSALDVPS